MARSRSLKEMQEKRAQAKPQPRFGPGDEGLPQMPQLDQHQSVVGGLVRSFTLGLANAQKNTEGLGSGGGGGGSVSGRVPGTETGAPESAAQQGDPLSRFGNSGGQTTSQNTPFINQVKRKVGNFTTTVRSFF